MQEPLDGSVRILGDARSVTVLTGAGMSSESGVPTFRDALTGLWAQYDPGELATPEAFSRNPARVFGWYLSRWRRVRAVEPHSGHHALVALADLFEEFSIITQNVDGLHQRAGSRDVVELHGSLSLFRCAAHGHPSMPMISMPWPRVLREMSNRRHVWCVGVRSGRRWCGLARCFPQRRCRGPHRR